MEQLEFFSVPSPCIRRCSTDAKGYCLGCMRTRDERFRWQTMSPVEQRHVIRLCQLRYRRKMGKGHQKASATDNQTSDNPQQDLF
ncbi:DUF1289 domain-containing protein [Vibrio zhugei]|uniref:DUF1289 domain-containing protein n=1 Tax=Vibrio zhugei TaxID=2479546 RepID=A0ABV7C675_9VIBR|nr:DUF1289 domain-containing protein [Vibrio zhugei]